MVLLVRIELTTSPLPRGCSTTSDSSAGDLWPVSLALGQIGRKVAVATQRPHMLQP